METRENTRFIYEFGKFVLDPHQKTLLAQGQPVRLPAKEFDTLVLLVEHNGKALSKEEMMSAIWTDAFVEESNLAKQISRLRKIINRNGEHFIETLPKHGYRFTADLRKSVPEHEDLPVLEKHTVKRFKLAVTQELDQPAGISDTKNNHYLKLQTGIIALVAVLAISAIAVWMLRQPVPPKTISSMAVLPLQSIGSDESSKELGLGLADTLISKIGSLKRVVVSPTS